MLIMKIFINKYCNKGKIFNSFLSADKVLDTFICMPAPISLRINSNGYPRVNEDNVSLYGIPAFAGM